MGISSHFISDNYRICTSSTRPSGSFVYEGLQIYETDTDLSYTYSGSAWVQMGNLGAWTAYTPILKNGGTSVTKTVAHARYFLIGRSCTVQIRCNVTSTGAAADIQMQLPFVNNNADSIFGTFHFYDASANVAYAGSAFISGNSGYAYGVRDNTTSNVGISTTMASGDVVWVSGTYEVAP